MPFRGSLGYVQVMGGHVLLRPPEKDSDQTCGRHRCFSQDEPRVVLCRAKGGSSENQSFAPSVGILWLIHYR